MSYSPNSDGTALVIVELPDQATAVEFVRWLGEHIARDHVWWEDSGLTHSVDDVLSTTLIRVERVPGCNTSTEPT